MAPTVKWLQDNCRFYKYRAKTSCGSSWEAFLTQRLSANRSCDIKRVSRIAEAWIYVFSCSVNVNPTSWKKVARLHNWVFWQLMKVFGNVLLGTNRPSSLFGEVLLKTSGPAGSWGTNRPTPSAAQPQISPCFQLHAQTPLTCRSLSLSFCTFKLPGCSNSRLCSWERRARVFIFQLSKAFQNGKQFLCHLPTCRWGVTFMRSSLWGKPAGKQDFFWLKRCLEDSKVHSCFSNYTQKSGWKGTRAHRFKRTRARRFCSATTPDQMKTPTDLLDVWKKFWALKKGEKCDFQTDLVVGESYWQISLSLYVC